MTVIPEVHRTIRDAVEAGDLKPKRGRSRWLPVLTVKLTFVACGTALAATGLWSPSLGNDGQVEPAGERAAPISNHSSLNVLRRPQSATDRSPAVETVLREMSSANLNGVHLDDVRMLADTGRRAAVLVPVAQTGPRGTTADESRRTGQLCLIFARDSAPPSEVCGDATDLTRIDGFLPADHTTTAGQQVVSGVDESHHFGLVPDGVRAVRVDLQDGTSLTAPVANNFYDASTSSTAPSERVTWLSPTGETVRTP